MKKSKDEYLMLREEILQLGELENNVMNFFYAAIAAFMAFSLKQQDTLFILLSYIIIIPAYKLVLSKVTGIYKIGAYLFVYQEGGIFNWERRSRRIYDNNPNIFLNRLQAFNFPYIFTSTFVTGIFFVKTEWQEICNSNYEIIKIILAVILYAYVVVLIVKNRHVDTRNFITYWEQVKKDEEVKLARSILNFSCDKN